MRTCRLPLKKKRPGQLTGPNLAEPRGILYLGTQLGQGGIRKGAKLHH